MVLLMFWSVLVSMILSYSRWVRFHCPLVALFKISPSRSAGVLERFSLDDLELLKMCETYSGYYFDFLIGD